ARPLPSPSASLPGSVRSWLARVWAGCGPAGPHLASVGVVELGAPVPEALGRPAGALVAQKALPRPERVLLELLVRFRDRLLHQHAELLLGEEPVAHVVQAERRDRLDVDPHVEDGPGGQMIHLALLLALRPPWHVDMVVRERGPGPDVSATRKGI